MPIFSKFRAERLFLSQGETSKAKEIESKFVKLGQEASKLERANQLTA